MGERAGGSTEQGHAGMLALPDPALPRQTGAERGQSCRDGFRDVLARTQLLAESETNLAAGIAMNRDIMAARVNDDGLAESPDARGPSRSLVLELFECNDRRLRPVEDSDHPTEYRGISASDHMSGAPVERRSRIFEQRPAEAPGIRV